MDDIKPQIKLSTYEIKNNIINTHIRPYFENMSLSDINATDVLKWQNEMLVSICGRKYLFRLMIGMNIQRQNYGEGHGQNIVTDTLMRKIRLIIEVMNVKV